MNPEIKAYLQDIYGEAPVEILSSKIETLINHYRQSLLPETREPLTYFTEQDSVLITYGDMVQTSGEKPLLTLATFLEANVGGAVNTVHLLPFFPYSSDDGFSVIDYKMVDPMLGDWQDLSEFRGSFRLMFDAVVNHISAQSDWFSRFKDGQPPYDEFFTVVDPQSDLTQVFRPRSLPLLTEVDTVGGPKWVWTTFSVDQIDLNYASPEVLLAVLDTLLFYVSQGAGYIRLDAIAFIWKEIGSTCIHLPQAHQIIQLMRLVLNEFAPGVVLITETNVPHEDNISYFGNGHNEAQMVYNFSLPPLTLHAFHSGKATVLSNWAKTLSLPSDEVTFFNFLASHDGIGVTPARGLVSDMEVMQLAQRVERLGGFVSYRSSPDGSQAAYELNINYLDALGDPDQENEEISVVARRFLAAQAIMLALRGVPGIYFHSLFGSRSWHEGVSRSGRNRTINRQKLQKDELMAELADPESLRSLILEPYLHMLRKRAAEPAFHPNGDQEVLDVHQAVFAVRRSPVDGGSEVICLHNVTHKTQEITLDQDIVNEHVQSFSDLISGRHYLVNGNERHLSIPPYGVIWLRSNPLKA